MKLQNWLVAGMMMAASTVCRGAEDHLTVVVLNYAGVDTRTLERAAGLSSDRFQQVGVETTWLVCPRPEECVLPPERAHVLMIVARQALKPGLGLAVLDTMATGTPRGYAFHRPVVECGRQIGYPAWIVLARVMVHETLHLLGLQHTRDGIMRATIDKRGLGDFGGSPLLAASQVKRVRDGVARLQPALVAASR